MIPPAQLIVLKIPAVFIGAAIVFSSILISIAGLIIVRHFISHKALKVHNDVAGPIFGTIGMAYTVLIAFIVVALWQDYDRANLNAEMEANCLVDMYRGAEAFPLPIKTQIQDLASAYAKIVVKDEWKAMARGKESLQVREVLAKMLTLYSTYIPQTETEKIFLGQSVSKLTQMGELRRMRIWQAKTGLHSYLWFVLIAGGITTILFPFFFGSENLRAQMVMSGLLAALISLILFTILLLDYPFTGDINVSPEVFRSLFTY